jgi:hypothetical protein
MTIIGRKIIIAGAVTLVLAAGSGIATAAVISSPSPVDSSGVIPWLLEKCGAERIARLRAPECGNLMPEGHNGDLLERAGTGRTSGC